MDPSNGYEGVAAEFLARRGGGRSTGIGVREVREWARTLPNGAAVIDLGCGPGFPITEVLVAERLDVFALEAAPSFVEAFRRNLSNAPSSVKLSKIRHFWPNFRRGPGMGAHVLAVRRRPTTPDPKHRRHIGAGWSATLYIPSYIPSGPVDMERCNDEFGITLGASRTGIAGLVLREAAAMLLAGCLIGAAGALSLARLIRAMLFEVSPADPGVFAVAAAVLVVAGLAAGWLPARRAARVDPMAALRCE